MENGTAEPEAQAKDVTLSDIPTLLVIRGALMMLFAVGVVGGLHAYLAHRLVGGLALGRTDTLIGYALFVALFLSIPLGFAAGRREPSWLTRGVLWVSHVWIGLFGLFLVGTLVAELSTFVTGPWSRAHSLTVLAAVIAVALWGYKVARSTPKVRRRKIGVRDLPAELEGLTVAQISDIHIGQTLDGAFLRSVVDRVNGLDADVVAVTGDLVDGFVSTTRDQVTALADLRGKLGVFYVTGNHEYYYGGAAWEAEVRKLGVTVLRNEHRILERGGARLAIAGVTDHDAGHFGDEHACRPDLALSGIPADVPRVLLAHQPRTALKVQDRVDLQLSGHTHGGQIFPFNFFVRLQQPVIRGFHVINGVPVYTHNGTGYWGPPMRVGPSSEIALLTLTRA